MKKEYYYTNKSSHRLLSILFELIKYGSIKPEEIKYKYEVESRTINKDIASIKEILYEYFDYDIELFYSNSKKEYYIVYNKGVVNYFLLPFDFDKK